MDVLYIGNSHLYTNDVPNMIKELFQQNQQPIQDQSITIGGQTLQGHYETPSTLQTIKEKPFDFILLQERASNFDAKLFHEGFENLNHYIRDYSKARIVLYMIWSNEHHPEIQKVITHAYLSSARETKSLVAPAGVAWDIIRHTHPEIVLYVDGNHATPIGSYLAALSIYYALVGNKERIQVESPLVNRLEIPLPIAQLIEEVVYQVSLYGTNCDELLVY